MAEVQEVGGDDFEQAVLESDKPVLVDFWAPWCGPCRFVEPVVEAIAEQYDDQIAVARVNVDEAAEIATSYHIQSIPTLMVFKNGEAVQRAIGVQPQDVVAQMIDASLEE